LGDDVPLAGLFGLLVVLLLLSAFFSGSETALMSLNRYQLRHKSREGHRGARLAENLLKRPDRLIGPPGRKHHGPAEIEPDDDRAVPLLPEHLGVRLPGARGDAPVDGAKVVAGLIRTCLVELDPSAFEPGQMPPGVQRADAQGTDPQRLPGLLEPDELCQLDPGRRSHGRWRSSRHGTPTRARSMSTISSGVRPAASASKLSRILCRSTSCATDWTSSGVT